MALFGRGKKASTQPNPYNLPDTGGTDVARLAAAKEKVQIEERIKAFYALSGGPDAAAETIERVTRQHLLHARDHGEEGKIPSYNDVISRFIGDDRSLSAVRDSSRDVTATAVSFMSQFAPRRDPGIGQVAKEIKGLADAIRDSRPTGTEGQPEQSNEAHPVVKGSDAALVERMDRIERKLDELLLSMHGEAMSRMVPVSVQTNGTAPTVSDGAGAQG